MADQVKVQDTQAQQNPPSPKANDGKGWTVEAGKASTNKTSKAYKDGGIVDLNFTNPFQQHIERAWVDGNIVYALELEEMQVTNTDKIHIAKEYVPVYSVQLDSSGWKQSTENVPGQLNIYDTAPSDPKYSAIWKFYYVIVPKDYQANSLRSEQDCLNSGYEIRESNYYRN